MIPHRPTRLALNSGQLAVYIDPADDPRFLHDDYLAQRRPRAIVCMPLSAAGESIGLIYLESALARDVFGRGFVAAGGTAVRDKSRSRC